MKKLSIIMPFLNEKEEPANTINSIMETSNIDQLEIIAIDDCSKEMINLGQKNVKYIRNKQRLGVDACRQIGIEMAESNYCLVIDAHMRFRKDDWVNVIIDRVDSNPNTLWCTTCVGLGYGKMNMNNHNGKYYGADLKLLTDQEKDRPCRQILEPKWSNEKQTIEYKIGCILGANYFFSRDWFLRIHGLKGLKSWGSSEPVMSLKSFMAGGDCRITKNIEIGHVFRDNAPYATPIADLVYNKIYILKTIFPKELEDKLMAYIPKDINYNAAMRMIESNKDIILSEKAYYESIFKYSIYDYCSQFDIKVP